MGSPSPADSSACALYQGPAPHKRPIIGAARPAWGLGQATLPREGAWAGRGRNGFFPGPRPGRAQLPAAPTMAAAAQAKVGSRPRAGETGEGVGRLGGPLPGGPLAPGPVRLRAPGARVPLRDAGTEGVPWRGA